MKYLTEFVPFTSEEGMSTREVGKEYPMEQCYAKTFFWLGKWHHTFSNSQGYDTQEEALQQLKITLLARGWKFLTNYQNSKLGAMI